MILTLNNLIDLPVYTKSGRHLGKISECEFDTTTQSVLRYYVKSESIIKQILNQKELIIHRNQVISITKEKMIVEEGIGSEIVKKEEKIKSEEPVTVGV